MPKIKITSVNRTQQQNVINKCRTWGAAARDGDYGPVAGKTAVVINTKIGDMPAIQLSRVDFNPSKNPYNKVISYKDFMNATTCPWGRKYSDAQSGEAGQPATAVAAVVVVQEVEVESGVCAQDTLKVKSCKVLEQEAIGFKTLGLPFLIDNGVEVTMSEDVAYILDVKNNTAKPLTAKTAAKNAKASITKGDKDVWADYAREFDLVDECIFIKSVEDDEDSSDETPAA